MKYLDLIQSGFKGFISDGYAVFTPVVRELNAQTQNELLAYVEAKLKDASNEMVCAFSNGTRDVYEQVINFTDRNSERVDLPLVIVVDHSNQQIRVYHTTWPMSGAHMPYPEIIPVGYDLQHSQQPEVFALYEKYLAEHDEKILSLFSADMVVKEASGKRYLHGGHERDAFYRAVLSGALPAEFLPTAVTVSNDQTRVAGEYLFGGQGRYVAGVGIWYLSQDGKQIQAVHIHDDADL